MATSARYALRSLARHSSRFGFVVRTLVILLAFFQALWAFTLIILRFGHPIGVFGIWLVLIGISSVLWVLIGC